MAIAAGDITGTSTTVSYEFARPRAFHVAPTPDCGLDVCGLTLAVSMAIAAGDITGTSTTVSNEFARLRAFHVAPTPDCGLGRLRVDVGGIDGNCGGRHYRHVDHGVE